MNSTVAIYRSSIGHEGDRKVAVKAFSPIRDWMMTHFDRSAHDAMGLKHPTIITIHDSFCSASRIA